MSASRDIIAAVATASGVAGVAIVRLSGPGCLALAMGAFRTARPSPIEPRAMTYGRFIDADDRTFDDGYLVHFPAPASFTGEDVVELHTHGGRAAPATMLARLRELGARMAEPGEFTRRALESGRIDLAQAEAILDVVHARSEASLRAASARLAGALSGRLRDLRERLISAKALVEAQIDFEDADVGDVQTASIVEPIESARRDLAALAAGYTRSRVFRDGALAVIAGRPNVGKSSLLNALVGRRRALVSEEPGTTRDAIEDDAVLADVPFRLVDTAGLRREAERLEAQGIEITRERIAEADLVVFVIDASAGETEEDRALREALPSVPIVAVANKCDLAALPGVLNVSAMTGAGLDALAAEMARAALGDAASGRDEALLASERHEQRTLDAIAHLDAALAALAAGSSPAITALEIADAARALGEIVGETTPDDVLGAIFSRFCIGK
ncbi:MAG: tRNA uridine-5-carboxymethylaminomethyl(34) synthesis GTPase MnmE [Deltaproteobacteria bacterium]|nr:tRNA uridine-5-carboxymethylaminomethyl(34) synthesis GTPase MnmE [Deltaproteobacteria bacterium]